MKYLFIFISIFTSILLGVEFRDDTFKLNFEYDESVWQVKESEKYKQRLILKHFNLPATINIIAYRFNETITANGLVQRRIQSEYDGWQRVSEQPISNLQTKQKNITEGVRSIYRKTYLDGQLNEQQEFVGDICLVTDDSLAIILNVTAQKSSTLLRIKDDFNQIYSSFWFGDDKPLANFVVSDESSWIKHNQNFTQRRFSESSFSLKEPALISNEFEFASYIPLNKSATYHNENGQYILHDDQLFFVNTFTNKQKSFSLDLKNPHIQLKNDGFYAIQKKPELVIKHFDLDFNETLIFTDSISVLDVFMVNNFIVTITTEGVQLLSPTKVVWSYEYSFRDIDYIANLEELIIADKDANELLFFNINKGELKSTLKLEEVSPDLTGEIIDIAMNQGKLLLTFKNYKNITQAIINPIKSLLEDQLILDNLKEFSVVGISNDFILVNYKNTQNESFLEAFDFNTFASVWKQSFQDKNIPLLINNEILFFNDQDPIISSFDISQSSSSVSTMNINKLVSQGVDQFEDNTQNEQNNPENLRVNLFKLVPLKNKLMALLKVDNKEKIIFISNKK